MIDIDPADATARLAAISDAVCATILGRRQAVQSALTCLVAQTASAESGTTETGDAAAPVAIAGAIVGAIAGAIAGAMAEPPADMPPAEMLDAASRTISMASPDRDGAPVAALSAAPSLCAFCFFRPRPKTIDQDSCRKVPVIWKS